MNTVTSFIALLAAGCVAALLMGIVFGAGFKIGVRYIGRTVSFSLDLVAPEGYEKNTTSLPKTTSAPPVKPAKK